MPRRTRKIQKTQQQEPTVPPLAKSISPGTNFYGHVNANWIKRASIPSYTSSYSVSEEIEDRIQPSLEAIVQKARQLIVETSNKELDEDTILLGNLYQSAIDHSSQDLSVKFVKNLVGNLRCMRGPDDIAAAIAEFAKFRIPSPITIFTGPEEKHSKQLRTIFVPGQISLPDTSYYTVEAPGRARLLDSYNSLLVKLGDAFDVANLNLFVGIEKIVADAIEQVRGDEEVLMYGRDIKAKYPSFDWNTFAKSAFGISPAKFAESKYLVAGPAWLKYINKWIKQWPLDNWRILLAGSLLVYVLPLLPPPFDQLHFDFFDHRLKGQTEKTPQRILGLKICKQWLSQPLGKQFLKCCVNPKLKREVKSLADEIVITTLKRIETIEWLEPQTRTKAIKKVSSIHIGVAYPDTMPSSPDVELNPEQFIKNIFALGTASFEKDFRKANTLLNPEKWEDAIFEVNAYYYNEGNRLILPAGILKYPFYSISASDGWNFGGIGATIGHELTHAFDMDGKDYDEHGNNKPWWTTNDNKMYNQKTKAIIALYNKTRYFNQYINGTLTLSENIADLGGLALALTALKNRLQKRRVSDADKKKELCDFFISYAVSWRTKEKRKKAIQSLFTDLHSPPIARVNNIVRQFDDWYECFDIKPGSLLYTAPQDRIRIF